MKLLWGALVPLPEGIDLEVAHGVEVIERGSDLEFSSPGFAPGSETLPELSEHLVDKIAGAQRHSVAEYMTVTIFFPVPAVVFRFDG